MKKKLTLLCALLCLCLLLAGCGDGNSPTLTGRYLRAENGTSLLVTEDGEPIALSDQSKDGGLFDGLNSGDRIEIAYDGSISETWPGQAGATSCKLLEAGTMDDIPEDILTELEDIGWTFGGSFSATGWYLDAAEGSQETGPLIVRDDTDAAIVESLVDKSEAGSLFDGLESGDRIQITFDMPESSPWPGVDWVFTCELLEEGTLSDIPEEALTTMEEAGYDFGRHDHQPAGEPQTVEDPVSGYCGNTVTKVTVDGEEYSFWGGDSVTLTDILENLAYDPGQVCRCMTEFTVDTEFGSGYGVNLTESFARCEAGQAALTAEQAEAIRDIIDRNCGG